MNNSDLPAMAQSVVDKEYWKEFMEGILGGAPTGLTKREHFAAMAMQGFISAGCNGMPDSVDLARHSVVYANALLKELDK